MADSQTPFSSEPTLKDALNLLKRDIFLSMNCHHLATIESFDASNQTAQASINYQRVFTMRGADGVYADKLEPYPVMIDCPVVCLGGGSGSMTFPIAKGDTAIALFNDRDIDQWFSSGSTTSAPETARLHSFSDAILLVGVRSSNAPLVEYDDDSVAIRYGDNKIRLYSDKFTVTIGTTLTFEVNSSGKFRITNATGEFVDLLVKLFTDITSGNAGGFPLILPPTYATELTQLQTFKV